MKKLLLIGTSSIHTYNYYNLVASYFDSTILISDKEIDRFTMNNTVIKLNFSFKSFFSIVRTIRIIRRTIQQFQPSVIHAHQIGTSAFLTLLANKGLKVPVVITAWGSDVLQNPHKGFLYNRMVKYVLSRANYFTADSLYVANKMNALVKSKGMDVSIINFGINVDSNTSVKKENIIYSNRLHEKIYRIDEIICAFGIFVSDRKNGDWKLVIAGSGSETKKLIDLANDLQLLEKIIFVGWLERSKNIEYYQRAKIYVSTPSSDATAVSLLEAMSLGCIPVVSCLPANMEWIINGLNGIVVKNMKDDFFEQALRINVELMAQINNDLIEKKGTKEVNKAKFLKLYDRIIN